MQTIKVLYKSVDAKDFPREFFHFFYGYLISGFAQILNLEQEQRDESHFVFESFGPILDAKTKELINQHSLSAEISKKILAGLDRNNILAPRWDLGILDLQSFQSLNVLGKVKRVIKRSFFYVNSYDQYLFKTNGLKREMNQISNRICPGINELRGGRKKILVLKRSKPDSRYNLQKTDGELHRIGTERRDLGNLEFGKIQFDKMGYDCEIYEPGYSMLSEQVKTFYSADVVIGIRGAELANVLWLRENSKVIVIDNFNDQQGSPVEQVAKFRNCNYYSIAVSNSKYHTLDENLIDQIVQFL